MMLQNPNFYVFGYIWIHVLNGQIFHFFKKQCSVVLTLCVALSCLLRHLMLWPKYNKSKMDNIQI